MYGRKLNFWGWVAAVLVAACLSVGASAAETGAGLGNKVCLSCHDGTSGKLQGAGAEGAKRELHGVPVGAFAKSVHSGMECIACHLEITDSVAPHKRAVGEKRPDCVQCHQRMKAALTQEKVAGERRQIQAVSDNIDSYKTSLHARVNADDPTRSNASCNDCHDVHSFNVPARGTPERTEWRLAIADLCGRCHEDQLKVWSKSVHGREVKQKHNAQAAGCADCHTAHSVKGTSSDGAKLAITANCGTCHSKQYASYRSTYHGQVNTLGYTQTAKCFDCHGSHDIEPPTDPKSKMNIENRLESCQECHSGKKAIPLASAGFTSFIPH